MGIFDFLKSKKTKIQEEWVLFNSLESEGKKNYLLNNPNSLIYFEVKEKIKIIKTKEDISEYENLIILDNTLKYKDESFYSNIYFSDLNEVINSIPNLSSNEKIIRLYFEKKIKFFTFYKIFNDDLYNIDLHPLKNGKKYVNHEITYNENSSLNEKFSHNLNEILLNLKSNEYPYPSGLRIRRSGGPIYLKSQIENHLINSYEKIMGDIKKIEQLQELYHNYKDFETKYINFSECGIVDRLGKWNYIFYNEEKEIEGMKLFIKINLILNS